MKYASGVYTHMLSTTHGDYAAYLDSRGPTDLILTLPAGEYSLTWIDVETGNAKASVRFPHGGGDKKLTSPEFRHGIVMRLARSPH